MHLGLARVRAEPARERATESRGGPDPRQVESVDACPPAGTVDAAQRPKRPRLARRAAGGAFSR